MSFTSQRPSDALLILKALNSISMHTERPDKIKFLEVGTFGGSTAQGVRDYCVSEDVGLEYWGIDNRAQIHSESPFPEAHFVVGDSAESFHLIPDGFSIVLLDGCHCINHVILDTLHYGKKVRVGGLLLFHDTNKECQQTMRDPHGPDIPEFHNSVLAAHALMGFPSKEWAFWDESEEQGAPFGGIRAYRKIA